MKAQKYCKRCLVLPEFYTFDHNLNYLTIMAGVKTKRGLTISKKYVPELVYVKLRDLRAQFEKECKCEISLERAIYKLIINSK